MVGWGTLERKGMRLGAARSLCEFGLFASLKRLESFCEVELKLVAIVSALRPPSHDKGRDEFVILTPPADNGNTNAIQRPFSSFSPHHSSITRKFESSSTVGESTRRFSPG